MQLGVTLNAVVPATTVGKAPSWFRPNLRCLIFHCRSFSLLLPLNHKYASFRENIPEKTAVTVFKSPSMLLIKYGFIPWTVIAVCSRALGGHLTCASVFELFTTHTCDGSKKKKNTIGSTFASHSILLCAWMGFLRLHRSVQSRAVVCPVCALWLASDQSWVAPPPNVSRERTQHTLIKNMRESKTDVPRGARMDFFFFFFWLFNLSWNFRQWATFHFNPMHQNPDAQSAPFLSR